MQFQIRLHQGQSQIHSKCLFRLQEYYYSISKVNFIQLNSSFLLDFDLTILTFYSRYFSDSYSYWISQNFTLHDHLVDSFNDCFLCFYFSKMNCCHCCFGIYLHLSILSHLKSHTTKTNYLIRKIDQTRRDDRTQLVSVCLGDSTWRHQFFSS